MTEYRDSNYPPEMLFHISKFTLLFLYKQIQWVFFSNPVENKPMHFCIFCIHTELTFL